jgi:hypothetical protein
MSNWFGDITEDGTLEIPFNTYDSNGGSVSFVGDTLKVYKGSATGTEVTEGITLSKDHDDMTGSHLVTIAATHAFYATGENYHLQLQDASIDSQTVNSFLGSFSVVDLTSISIGTVETVLGNVDGDLVGGVLGDVSGGATAAGQTIMTDLIEGDEELKYSVQPAQRIIYRKGTEDVILSKSLIQIDLTSDITSVTQTIGKSVNI